ncbi:unnamed protein product [Closterium sp. Yama58-4]|nr:unnamed protein product [Closterium sp. Yama58-4]
MALALTGLLGTCAFGICYWDRRTLLGIALHFGEFPLPPFGFPELLPLHQHPSYCVSLSSRPPRSLSLSSPSLPLPLVPLPPSPSRPPPSLSLSPPSLLSAPMNCSHSARPFPPFAPL